MNDPVTAFAALSVKILPLYLIIGLGYLAGRRLGVGTRPVAQLAIYIVAPIFAFGFLASARFDMLRLYIPVLWFAISLFMRWLSFTLARRHWTDGTEHLLSAGLSIGNTGFLGIPVALAVFDPHTAALFIVAQIADFIYGNSILYYTVARGRHSMQDSFLRLFRLPPFYAVFAGLLYSFSGLPPLPEAVTGITEAFKGCYIVLGMLIVGLALAEMKGFKTDLKFLVFGNFFRLLAWPGLVFAVMALAGEAMEGDVRRIMALYVALPIATNTVVYASEMNMHPEKAAMLVVSSTFLSLITIPLFCTAFAG